MHKLPVRSAAAGDVCVLLVPRATANVEPLIQKQWNLQTIYGGELTQPIHLTCQRFAASGAQLDVVLDMLESLCSQTPILDMHATELLPFYSHFRAETILKARIEMFPALCVLIKQITHLIELQGLEAMQPWLPELVTLLEGIDDRSQAAETIPFSHPLYTAEMLTVSRIIAPYQYEILASFDLKQMPQHMAA